MTEKGHTKIFLTCQVVTKIKLKINTRCLLARSLKKECLCRRLILLVKTAIGRLINFNHAKPQRHTCRVFRSIIFSGQPPNQLVKSWVSISRNYIRVKDYPYNPRCSMPFTA